MFGIDDLLIGLAVGGIGSAISGAVGSANAASAQEQQAAEAMKFQREMWEQQRADQAPWLEAGRTSLAQLLQQHQAGAFDRQIDPSQIANDPGYQFRMAEGQKALERSAASRGMLSSGGFARGLTRYSQGVASDEFQNAWNRNQATNTGRYNRLAALAGVGQQSAQNLGALGANHAGQMTNLYGAIGNAQSAGAVGTANAVSGGMNTLGNLFTMNGLLGRQQQIPQQPQYIPPQSSGVPAYGQSSEGYYTQGFGPWR